MDKLIRRIALAALVTPFASAATVTYNFNTPGDTEGFTASTSPANALVTGFNAALGINGSSGVLTSSDVNIDPQVGLGATVTLPSGESWASITIRFRQLNRNPGEAGVAGAPYDGNGTIIFFNNSTQNLGVAALATKTVNGAGGFAGDTYNMTLTGEAEAWQVMSIDLTAAPTLNSGDITAMRFDPVGNADAKNFEIDSVSFQSIPEPSSAFLTAIASLGLLLRRRK